MSDSAPTPVFAAPWHAQLFAITVHLHAAGLFTWPDWTARFGAVLARQGLSRALDGGDDYFDAWRLALEALLEDCGLGDPARLDALRDAWAAAYLNTPHGAPVRLG